VNLILAYIMNIDQVIGMLAGTISLNIEPIAKVVLGPRSNAPAYPPQVKIDEIEYNNMVKYKL